MPSPPSIDPRDQSRNRRIQGLVGWFLVGIVVQSVLLVLIGLLKPGLPWTNLAAVSGHALVLAVLAVLAGLSAGPRPRFQGFQVALMFLFGCLLLANLGTSGTPAMGIFNVLAPFFFLVLSYLLYRQYQLTFSLGTKVLAVLFLTAALYNDARNDLPWDRLGAVVASLVLLFVLIHVMTGQALRFYRRAQMVTERENAALVTFANLGLTVNSITHDIQGRIALQRNLVQRLNLEGARKPDGSVTLTPEEASRFREFHDLLDRSCLDVLQFTTELRSRLMGADSGIQAFDLRELVKRLVHSTGVASGVEIGTQLPSLPVNWTGSPAPWIQVIENILRNALDAGGPGVHIKVTLRTEAATIVLILENDGPPLSPCVECAYDRKCLDQRCHTFAFGKTSKPDGSGTGLVTVIQTIQDWKGTLKIESSPLVTRFSLSVPQQTMPPLESPPARS